MGHRGIANRTLSPGTAVRRFVIALCAATFFAMSVAEARSLGVPGVRGGVVTTSEPTAAAVGASVLRDGGNAIDAAAAVAFALNVVEPQSSGIGGGGFMMIHLAGSHETLIVDSRERAPAKASPDMFLDGTREPFGFSIRSTSGVSVGVPGMVRGVALALEKWGTQSLAEVLQPAIKLAEGGFLAGSRLEQSIAGGLDADASGRLANEPGTGAYDVARSVFAPGGKPLVQKDRFIQPDLAKTLRLIAERGPDAFYRGEIAAAIVETQRAARTTDSAGDPIAEADAKRLRGRMTLKDLIDYEAVIRKPVEGIYRDFRIVSMPPPSSGGLTVLQALKLIERFPIGNAAKGFSFGSKRTLNVMMESMRLAFADRAVWMGDDDFVKVPKAGLLDEGYIANRSRLIDPDKRQAEVAADDPRVFEVDGAMRNSTLAAVSPSGKEGFDTTHFSIVDHEGNIVSYTNTIESRWGTGLMVPGFGFLLNNELTDFNRAPTFNADPESYNPGANDAAPFKRPRSSMAPTMVYHENKPVAAYGSPGGSTIINSVFNLTVNLIDHRMNVQEAVDAPRISQTSAGGSPTFETGFERKIIDELISLGHDLSDSRLRSIGSVQAIVIDKDGKRQFGAADRRRVGGIVSLRRDDLNPRSESDDPGASSDAER